MAATSRRESAGAIQNPAYRPAGIFTFDVKGLAAKAAKSIHPAWFRRRKFNGNDGDEVEILRVLHGRRNITPDDIKP